jgi:hypothetical protein
LYTSASLVLPLPCPARISSSDSVVIAGREPRRRVEISGGVCGLDGSAVFASSPQPSGLPEPAGRFHRGATRGELDALISGRVEEANT